MFKEVPVAYSVPSTQTDMPLVIQPSVMTGWGDLTLAQMQSMRVYADADKLVEIPREAVSADELHYLAPSVTSTSKYYFDYDGIRADYAVGATYGRNAVWSDYEFVSHDGGLAESTGNVTTTNFGTALETTNVAIGGEARSFVSEDYIYTNYNPRTSIGTGDFSVQIWSEPNTANRRDVILYIGDDANFHDVWYLYWGNAGREDDVRLQLRKGTAGGVTFTADGYKDLAYHSFTTTRSGTTAKVYIDGGVEINQTNAGVDVNLGDSFQIGVARFTPDAMQGYQDEVRLRADLLSADWITTEYNNQNNIGSFYGTVVDAGGGGGGYTPTPLIHMMQMSGGLM